MISEPQKFVCESRGDSRRAYICFALFGVGVLVCVAVGALPEGFASDRGAIVFTSFFAVIFLGWGLLGAFLKRVIVLDSTAHHLVEAATFFGVTFSRRSFEFDELRCIEFDISGFETSDAKMYQVGIRPFRGRIVWLRAFMAPGSALPTEARSFIDELAAVTGLKEGNSTA